MAIELFKDLGNNFKQNWTSIMCMIVIYYALDAKIDKIQNYTVVDHAVIADLKNVVNYNRKQIVSLLIWQGRIEAIREDETDLSIVTEYIDD